jgi:hypothetical protein
MNKQSMSRFNVWDIARARLRDGVLTDLGKSVRSTVSDDVRDIVYYNVRANVETIVWSNVREAVRTSVHWALMENIQ